MVRYLTSLGAWEYLGSTVWENLYYTLVPFARRLVHSSGIRSWLGQEEAFIEDIVQETMVHALKYAQRAEHGEVPAVDSFKSMSIRIAHNYYTDLRRRERSFVSLAPYGDDHYLHADLLYCWPDCRCDTIAAKHHRVSAFKSVNFLNQPYKKQFLDQRDIFGEVVADTS